MLVRDGLGAQLAPLAGPGPLARAGGADPRPARSAGRPPGRSAPPAAGGHRSGRPPACGRARRRWSRPERPSRSAPRRRWSRSPARPRRWPARPPCCSVTADDGQPSQLPSSRRWTAPTASSSAEQLDVAAVAARGTGRTESSAAATRVGQVVGVEAVHDEAGWRPARRRPARSTSSGASACDQLDDPGQARAVELGDQRGAAPRPGRTDAGSARGAQLVEQRLDPVAGGSGRSRS